MTASKQKSRISRRNRIRARVKGTPERPRLSIFRSNRHVVLQVIDDIAGKTLIAVDDRGLTQGKKGKEKKTRVQIAETLGDKLAKQATEKAISQVVFDRGGYRYHGIVKAVAEGARKGGLTF